MACYLPRECRIPIKATRCVACCENWSPLLIYLVERACLSKRVNDIVAGGGGLGNLLTDV